MLTFIIAMLIALATGTSWGTMAILFPLILVPTYEVSDGNATIFYAVVSAVLGGAVAGDHMSPISDATVISALACDVKLVAHVYTQAPYVFVTVFCVIIFGYLPIGYEAWPNMIGILLGWSALFAFVFAVCVPVLSPTGRWDVFTKLCCARGYGNLDELGADTIKKANGETVTAPGEEEHMGDDKDVMDKDVMDKDGMQEGEKGSVSANEIASEEMEGAPAEKAPEPIEGDQEDDISA